MLTKRCRRLMIVALSFATAMASAPAGAVTLDGPYRMYFQFTLPPLDFQCDAEITQAGSTLSIESTSCPATPFSLSGTIDPATGAFDVSGTLDLIFACGVPGGFHVVGTTDEDEYLSGSFDCGGVISGPMLGSRIGGPSCGNHVVDPGEECDGSTCCWPSCHLAAEGRPCVGSTPCRTDFVCTAGECAGSSNLPAGTDCNADANVCTPEQCDAAGACLPGGAPPDCGPCEECRPSSGCELAQPQMDTGTCEGPIEPSGKLTIVDKAATATTAWSLGRGPAIASDDLGDPTTTTDWELCVWGLDEFGLSPLLALELPAGSSWRAVKGGFRFRQNDAAGRTAIELKTGVAGKSKVTAKHKGALTIPGGLAFLRPPFVAELHSSEGACLGAKFQSPRVLSPTTLRAKDGVLD